MPDPTVYVNYSDNSEIHEFIGATGIPCGEFFRIACEDGSVVYIPGKRIKDVIVEPGRA